MTAPTEITEFQWEPGRLRATTLADGSTSLLMEGKLIIPQLKLRLNLAMKLVPQFEETPPQAQPALPVSVTTPPQDQGAAIPPAQEKAADPQEESKRLRIKAINALLDSPGFIPDKSDRVGCANFISNLLCRSVRDLNALTEADFRLAKIELDTRVKRMAEFREITLAEFGRDLDKDEEEDLLASLCRFAVQKKALHLLTGFDWKMAIERFPGYIADIGASDPHDPVDDPALDLDLAGLTEEDAAERLAAFQ